MNICPIKGVCRESNHVISVTVMSPLIIGTGTDGVTLNKYLINRWIDRWVNENRVSRNLEGDNTIKHWCRKQKMIHLTKQFQNVSSVSGCVLDNMTQDIRIRLLSNVQVPHLEPFNFVTLSQLWISPFGRPTYVFQVSSWGLCQTQFIAAELSFKRKISSFLFFSSFLSLCFPFLFLSLFSYWSENLCHACLSHFHLPLLIHLWCSRSHFYCDLLKNVLVGP